MPSNQHSTLLKTCQKEARWVGLNVTSTVHGENKLTRNLIRHIIKTSLKLHNKVSANTRSLCIARGLKFNNDAVLVEIIIFMICFTQAGLKRSLSDMWDVPIFKTRLQDPVMKTGPDIFEKIVMPNYYDLSESPFSLNLIRISEYFKQDGINSFISNLTGVILQGYLCPEYEYKKDIEIQKLQESIKSGLGQILAEHDITAIKIAGKSA